MQQPCMCCLSWTTNRPTDHRTLVCHKIACQGGREGDARVVKGRGWRKKLVGALAHTNLPISELPMTLSHLETSAQVCGCVCVDLLLSYHRCHTIACTSISSRVACASAAAASTCESSTLSSRCDGTELQRRNVAFDKVGVAITHARG
jgi:hypothetical protein